MTDRSGQLPPTGPTEADVQDVVERIFAAAFKSFEEAIATPGKLTDSLGVIAAAALRVAVICLDETFVPKPGQRGSVTDGAIADLVRIMAMRELENLRENGERLRPLRPKSSDGSDPPSDHSHPSLEIVAIYGMFEVSLGAGHQQISECFRKPEYHRTALRPRRGFTSRRQHLRAVLMP